MSTKIYSGYKINNINSFQELETFRSKLLEKAKIAQRFIAQKLMIYASVEMLDLYRVGFDVPDVKSKLFNYGYHKVQDKLRDFKKNSRKNPVYDLRFEIVVFLSNPMLAMFIGDNNEMKKVFSEHPNVEYYGYWNNSEGPDDVSEADWEKRKEDWDFLEGPVCDNGFIISASDFIHYDFSVDTFSKEMIPLWENRVKVVSRNIVLNKVDNNKIQLDGLAKIKQQVEENKNSKDTSKFVQMANLVYNWVHKGDGVKEVEKEMKQVETILIKNIEYHDLFNRSFSDFERISRLN